MLNVVFCVYELKCNKQYLGYVMIVMDGLIMFV